MTEDLSGRIDDLLSNATTELESLQAAADGEVQLEELDDSQRESIRKFADEATELLETSEPARLLDALGLGGEDGPGSIPEAILTGEPGRVAELRALLTLSRLAPDADDETDELDPSSVDEGTLSTLSTLLGTRAVDAKSTDESDESTADEPTDEAAGKGDRITSTLRSALDDVSADIGDAFGEDDEPGLFDRGGDGILGGDDGGEEDEAESDDGLLETEGDDELLETEGDDGLVGGDESGDRKTVGGFGRSTHSTMPAQDRPDLVGVKRYSTMPDR